MKLLRTGSTDPYFNLALEERLFRSPGVDFNGIFLLWQNEDCIVFGKNQNPYAEMDVERAEELGVKLVRRITGGGAVFHDLGNINYSFLAPRTWADPLDYAFFEAPLVDALKELGLDVVSNGRNDLLIGDKKISGVAQTSDERMILHHGTLLFDAKLDRVGRLLTPSPEKLKRNHIKSVQSRVANVRPLLKEDCDTKTFIGVLEEALSRRFGTSFETIPDTLREEVLQSDLYKRNIDKKYILGTEE